MSIYDYAKWLHFNTTILVMPHLWGCKFLERATARLGVASGEAWVWRDCPHVMRAYNIYATA
jgi:hypothetical protein